MKSKLQTLFILSATSACVLEADDGPDAAEVEFRAEPIRAENFNGNQPFSNDEGQARTFSPEGNQIELDSAFSEDFGVNGRTCVVCHAPEAGWTITPELVQEVFDDTDGLDPLFRTVDGSNSPDADVSTLAAREEAYSLLLSRAVIRVGMPIPSDAEFELVAVDDPYGFASASELSLFRRPLPSANLTHIPDVMWDGRETAGTLEEGLANQANGATLGHAQAMQPLSQAERDEIVDFEINLFHAQSQEPDAGRLDRAGGLAGPENLANADGSTGAFDLFDGWTDSSNPTRAAIARGQRLFNEGSQANGGPACGGCHSVSNVGVNAAGVFFDIGISAEGRRSPDVPLYTLRNLSTGETRRTTDPGRALITGRWSDVDRFKVPNIRGLASRAPYFHDGSAATLLDVIRHYEQALGFDFTSDEEQDLVAFLAAL